MQQKDNDIRKVFNSNILFSSCDSTFLSKHISEYRIEQYANGDTCWSEGTEPSLYIIASGSATVYSNTGGSEFVLRTLDAGDIFGVASLFASANSVSRVIANTDTTAVIVPASTMRQLLIEDTAFSFRYITFLSDRIRFLNSRLACLSAGSATARLVAWFDTNIPNSVDSYVLTIPISRLCESLDIGRASLYRAFDELEANNFLSRSGKHFELHDRAKMRRQYGIL